MKIKRTLLHSALVLVTAGTLVACGQDSEEKNKVEDSLSQAGDAIEQTIDDAGDALNSAGESVKSTMDDAGDSLENTMTDAGNAVEDTCEQVKEKMDSKDTDC
ncbi:hypothetical protein [Marinomonas sp. THO17]|uniref:hypothetical protein n=1 Tax=Marinomonas sp. THO17 TaxID=3149048 RepID=UPI00336BF4EC